MTIRQTITFNASPDTLYKALTSSTEFAKATGADADISKDQGGEFCCFGGQITGRNIELIPGERIVQAWRAAPWAAGVYSIVRFDIRSAGASTTIDLEHSGYPDGGQEHLEGGWHKMYWEPLKEYIG